MSNVTHLLVLLGLFAGLSEAALSQDEAVLFIGNSYTFESNAAGQFESIARANGHDVEVRLDAAPGAGIGRALADEDLMEAIRQGQYTHLILQPGGMSDNGQWRLDGRGIAATSLPPLAERLARYSEVAAGAGVEIWVVETWPSSTGTTGDRDNLRARLVEAIINSGGTVHLLPVGRAVWLARESGTEQLYQEDGHHPGAATATLYAQLAYQAVFAGTPGRPEDGIVDAAEIGFQRTERGWTMNSGEPVELARYDDAQWDALSSIAQAAWLTRSQQPAPVQPDWPRLPESDQAIELSDLVGYWEGETGHFPREWPWPAQMTLNICRTDEGLRSELTYLFRDETGQVLRRDHLHLEARLEGNQLVIMRDGALFGGAETLRAVMTDENALSGTASLLDPAANLRVEGRWSAERRGQSWNCFGDH